MEFQGSAPGRFAWASAPAGGIPSAYFNMHFGKPGRVL